MSNLLTREQIERVIPKSIRKNISNELIDNINNGITSLSDEYYLILVV
jgi:hypothetical protein